MMLTKTNRARKEGHVLSFEPTIGSVLSDVNGATLKQDLFAIVGKSYDGIAMIRLFEHIEINTTITDMWYRLSYKIKPVRCTRSFLLPLYADLSRVIIKGHSPLVLLLSKYPERLTGIVHKRDVDQIAQTICGINTISKEVKNRYFNFY